jgi:hypothetical protein
VPTHRVTPAASEVIRRGKTAGKSSRQIAEILREQLGIVLDQRTISRHAKASPANRKATGPPRRESPPKASTKAVPEVPDEPETVSPFLDEGIEDTAPTLNETAALEREVIRLQNLLATDIPNRDRVALVGELRQSLKSIRQVKAAAKTGQRAEDQEVAATVAKLKRFALRNVKDFGEADEPDAVPEVGSAAVGQ